MTKREYMRQLEDALREFDPEMADEILEDYENHFQSGMAAGRSEEDLVNELGSIDEMIAELHDLMKEDADVKKQEPEHCQNECGDNVVNNDKCRHLVINLLVADTRIRMSDDDRVHLDYRNEGSRVSKSNLRFTAHQEGDTFYAEETIKKEGRFTFFGGNFSSNSELVVRVPRGFESISLVTKSGDVVLQNVHELEGLSIKSTSGDVEINGGKIERVSMDLVSGDVFASRFECEDLSTKAVSGDIRFEDTVYENADINAVSGDINIEKLTDGSATTATSVSGDVKVVLEKNADVKAKTTSGDIVIEVGPGCTGFELDAKNKFGGRDEGVRIRSKEAIRYENGRYCYGDGGSQIIAHAGVGDVTVRHIS